MPPSLLLDGHSLTYRAFFALPTDLATASGQVTNAVYGFTSMLINLIRDHRPDRIVVAWDRPEPTFRHEAVPTYKGNRDATPALLSPQFGLAREVIEVLPFVDIKHLMRDFELYFFHRDDSAEILVGLTNAYQKLLSDTLPTKASFIRTLKRAEHLERGWDPEVAQQEIETLRAQLNAEREKVASLRDALAREKERKIARRIGRLLGTN